MLETLLVVVCNLHSTFPLAGVGVVVQCHKLPLLVRLIPEQLVIAILLSSPPFWRPGLAHPLPHKKLVKKAGTGHWEEKYCEKTKYQTPWGKAGTRHGTCKEKLVLDNVNKTRYQTL